MNKDNSILDIAKQTVKLEDIVTGNKKRISENIISVNPCPSCGHKDHFMIYTDTNSFKSFSDNINCCNGGSVVDYFIQVDNMSKEEAIREVLKMVNGECINVVNNEVKSVEEKIPNHVHKIDNLSNNCKRYCESRDIIEKTLNHFEIGTYFENNTEYIAFPYYHECKVAGVKIRKPQKIDKGEPKYRSIKDSKYSLGLIFNEFNLDRELDDLYLCEGEFDAMITHQCGFENVISIPNGVSSIKSIMPKRKQFFNSFKNIYVLSDNDKAGEGLDEYLKEELKEKVHVIDKRIMDKIKDISEFYHRKGKDETIRLIKSAMPRIKGHTRVCEYNLNEELKNNKVIGLKTGFPTLDKKFNLLRTGYVTVVGGHTSQGKSTIAEQIQNITMNDGYRVLRVDGEHSVRDIITSSYIKIVGNDKSKYDLVKNFMEEEIVIKKDIEDKLKKWVGNKFHIYKPNEEERYSLDLLFDKLAYLIKSEKITLVMLDNLMSLAKCNSENETYAKQGDFIDRCCTLAQAYNVHILVMAHNNKGSNKTNVNEYSISGSGKIVDRADNVIQIVRENELITKNGITINGTISIVKNRSNKGKLALLKDDSEPYNESTDERIWLNYDETSRILYEYDKTSKTIMKNFINIDRVDFIDKGLESKEAKTYMSKVPATEVERFKKNIEEQIFECTIIGATEDDLPY